LKLILYILAKVW